MIDIRFLKYDGRQRNYQNGLTFYFTRQGHVLNFLIDVVGDRKRKIKVTMHPDSNHVRAHVHLDGHSASFAVDNGELIAGNCDTKIRKLIGNWIIRHQEDLFQLWDIIKRGEKRYQSIVENIRLERSFEEWDFKGKEPRYKNVIDEAAIWHNDKLLTEKKEDGNIIVIGTGDIFVGVPADYPEGYITIVSLDGKVQVKRWEV